MPRDGSGVYSQPYPDVVSGATIESAKYNGNVNDVEQDLNTPRPIVAGGTGATTAAGAMAALGGEIAMQNVTNYDTFPFVAGSFSSVPGTTSEPLAGGYFLGYCYVHAADPNAIFLEGRQYTGVASIGPKWVRHKASTSGWTAWQQQAGSVADLDAAYVNVAGDTMTGPLRVGTPAFATTDGLMVGGPSADPQAISFLKNSVKIWSIGMGPADGYFRIGGDSTIGPLGTSWTNGLSIHPNAYDVHLYSTTASTSPTTGALTVAGGVGITGSVNIGNSAGYSVVGQSVTTGNSRLDVIGPTTGTNPGGIIGVISGSTTMLMGTASAILGGTYNPQPTIWSSSGSVYFGNATASTSPTTGALTVAGGVGIAGNLCINNDATTSAIIIGGFGHIIGRYGPTGGLLIGGGQANISFSSQNPVSVANTTASSSPTTGALTVAGGVGMAGNLYLGGSEVFTNGSGISWKNNTGVDLGSTASGLTLYTDNNFYMTNSQGQLLLRTGAGTTIRMSIADTNVNITPTTASSSPSTGALTVAGGVGVSGALNVGSNARIGASSASGICYLGSGSGFVQFDGASFYMVGGPLIVASNTLTADGRIYSNTGYACRSGSGGGFGANVFNFQYTSPNMQMWVDNTYMGVVAIASDYRIKKDVIDLPGMWDTVKALRPIKYTGAQFTPPSHVKFIAEETLKARKEAEENPEAKPREVNTAPLFEADDIERWGFIAHELQATLTPSASTGEKDSPDTIQSPNPFTLIAALTKALQEAMARIEALEAKP